MINESAIKKICKNLKSSTIIENDFIYGTVVSVSPLKIRTEISDAVIELSGNMLYVSEFLRNHTLDCLIREEGSENERAATITVNNALRNGDKVVLLAFNDNQKYYVAERLAR
jgi:hypothetical protein